MSGQRIPAQVSKLLEEGKSVRDISRLLSMSKSEVGRLRLAWLGIDPFPANRGRSRGQIYVADVDSGLIKIGFSSNPARRIAEVRVDHSLEIIRLIGAVPASQNTERALHEALRPHAALFFRRPCAEFYHPTDFVKSLVGWLINLENADDEVARWLDAIKRAAQQTAPVPAWLTFGQDGGRR